MYRLTFRPSAVQTLDHLLSDTRSTGRYAEAFDALSEIVRSQGMAAGEFREGLSLVRHGGLTFCLEPSDADPAELFVVNVSAERF